MAVFSKGSSIKDVRTHSCQIFKVLGDPNFRGVFLVYQEGLEVLIFLGFLRNIVEKIHVQHIVKIINVKNYVTQKSYNIGNYLTEPVAGDFFLQNMQFFWRNFMKIHHFEGHSPCLGVVWGISPT